jgi:fibronectin-binding autotransporter adhesin
MHSLKPMKTSRKLFGFGVTLLSCFATGLSLNAQWIPSTGGTYSYENLSNWTAGDINNTFLPASYSGTAQTVTVAGSANWNSEDPITTGQINGTTLLLRANGGDLSLDLSGVRYQITGNATGVSTNYLQFGTTTAGQGLSFNIGEGFQVGVSSDFVYRNAVIFNGSLTGAGDLLKTGNGSLYLQNAASTFSGALDIQAGQVVLAGAGATLATQEINIGRMDALMRNTDVYAGTKGSLVLGNNVATLGTSSGTAGANANRISDTAVVNLTGGNLQLRANNGEGNSLMETLGTVNLSRGVSDIVVNQSATGTNNVTTLNITAMTRSVGTGLAGFGANSGGGGRGTFGTGAALESRILIGTINGQAASQQVVNGIIPWAVNSTDMADWWYMSNGDFLTYGANGLTAATGFVNDINAASATDNVKVTGSAQALSGNRTINSLTIFNTDGLTGTGNLTLTAGAVNLIRSTNPSGGILNIYPNLNFNGREGIIFVQSAQFRLLGNLTNTDGNGLTINGVGSNNTTLSPFLRLSGTNTYTGKTTINAAYLDLYSSGALPTNTDVVINEGGGLGMNRINFSIASLSGVGVVEFSRSGVAPPSTGTSTLTVGSANSDTEYAGIIRDGGTGTNTGNIVKVGTGKWTLSGQNAYTGTTRVQAGSLIVNGSIASSSSVTVDAGAELGGYGNVSTITGAGLVGPGQDVGILSAVSVTASAGLDFAFEFTLAGAAPSYGNRAASGNDVLRLTGGTAFTSVLDSNNQISLYLNVASLSYGDTFTGGFYVDGGDFFSSIEGANFAYYIADAGGSVLYRGVRYSLYTGPFDFTLGTKAETADFGQGDVNGYAMTFQAVPEPSIAALLILGMGAFFIRRRTTREC